MAVDESTVALLDFTNVQLDVTNLPLQCWMFSPRLHPLRNPAHASSLSDKQGTTKGTMGLAVAATDLYQEGGWGGLASNTARGLAGS